MPLISVIIPMYNTRRFMDRCVISLLEQTFSDFEAIFVNDGSIDNCAQVVRQFARNDSRVVLEEHAANLGPGAARNTGIARAKADYITFVDSDDFVDPDLLDMMFKATDHGFFDIVETGCRWINEEDDVLSEYIPVPARTSDLQSHKDSILLMQEWGVPQKLWRKSLFTDNRISFPEGIFWEDIAVVPALLVSARTFVAIDHVGYNYLQHVRSVTHSRSLKHILDMFRAYEYFRIFLVSRGLFPRYKDSFEKAFDISMNYLAEHIRTRNRTNPEKSDLLIRVCRVLAGEYLTSSEIVERFPAERLESALERHQAFDINSVDERLRPVIARIFQPAWG